MKIRIDFVTNSSSSSFILGVLKNFSPEQKDEIITFLIDKILGDTQITTQEELDKYIEEYNYDTDSEEVIAMQKALDSGKIIKTGVIDWDDGSMIYKVMEGLWNKIKEVAPNNIDLIDTDLSY